MSGDRGPRVGPIPSSPAYGNQELFTNMQYLFSPFDMKHGIKSILILHQQENCSFMQYIKKHKKKRMGIRAYTIYGKCTVLVNMMQQSKTITD